MKCMIIYFTTGNVKGCALSLSGRLSWINWCITNSRLHFHHPVHCYSLTCVSAASTKHGCYMFITSWDVLVSLHVSLCPGYCFPFEGVHARVSVLVCEVCVQRIQALSPYAVKRKPTGQVATFFFFVMHGYLWSWISTVHTSSSIYIVKDPLYIRVKDKNIFGQAWFCSIMYIFFLQILVCRI